MITRISLFAAMALMVAATGVSAQTVQVGNNGTLTGSTYSNPNTTTTNNDLTLNTGSSGFNFSGVTGSFSLPVSGGAFSSGSTSSQNGYYYADYLITISGSTAESVTTSLETIPGYGINNLSERIYNYNSASGSNGFLGDAAYGPGIIQAWSNDYALPGVNVSIISPTTLVAGSYVIELRGSNIGNFGGTLSITPAVPEPKTYTMLLVGLILIGLVAFRRKHGNNLCMLAIAQN